MKYAVVTGASSGIGKAIATKLAREGYFVFITYKSNLKGANETLQSIKTVSDGMSLCLDLQSSESIQQFIKDVRTTTKNLEVLVNNAAITGDLVDYFSASFDDIAHVVNTNITGTFLLTQKLIPLLKESQASFIINIGYVYPFAVVFWGGEIKCG